MNSTNENLKRKVWMCINRYKVKGEKECQNKHIDDKVLYQTFINTFNAVIENKDYFIEKWKENLKNDSVLVRYKAKQFIKTIEKVEQIKEFDVNLFLKLIDKMTVF